MPLIKDLVIAVLQAFGYSINIKTKKRLLADLLASPKESSLSAARAKRVLKASKSQLGQDVLALMSAGVEKPGFFVEFGAANGVSLSNSYLLEKEFGWKGIIAEPGRQWHKKLKENRTCEIEFRCVYSTTGEKLSFSENYLGELSGLTKHSGNSETGVLNRTTSSYEVETISLIDLLDSKNAPKHIDFLSVDTEGSEFAILNAFDFSKYTFGAISVEHNYTDSRQKVHDLLTSKGYRQVYPELSDFDDWFALAN